MEFSSSESIYIQIADYISDKILLGEWTTDEKISSVRELAIELEVNPNTVNRSYEFLQHQEVIYTKRGLGFFVAPKGKENIKSYKRRQFFEKDLPGFYRNLLLLEIDILEIEAGFQQYKLLNKGSNK
ncbi:GntR family transcriptional regulator [Mucilaginibacter rubeus]|nr:GntR family transcriptional regulator [Mucilaginibacter rubeus]